MQKLDFEDHRDRLNEAIAWYLRLKAPDAGTRAEFAAWLESDPRNRSAFDRVEDIDTEIDVQMLDAALKETGPKAFLARRESKLSHAGALRNVLFGAAALAAAALLVVLFFSPRSAMPAINTYTTAIGEIKIVTLADGSKITLNTATTLSIAADRDRHIVLKNGEALFQVIHDAQHPFIVTVGDRNVRDTGTLFDVSRMMGKIAVAVATGKVSVTPTSSDSAAEIALAAGEELNHVENSDITTLRRVDPEQVTSWENGYLIYRNAPISQVVAELNRYFAAPLVWDGPGERRFSGVLKIDNETAVVEDLTHFLHLASSRSADGKIHLQALRNSTK